MKIATTWMQKLWMDEAGMETVEWAVLAALIVAGLVGVISSLGGKVLAAFTRINSQLP